MASNDIDTAAIRAEVEQWGEALAGDWVWALCDALDAARAELMDQSDRRMDAKFYADPELLVRAEAAEARIAAGLDVVFGGHIVIGEGEYILRKDVRRALTGTAR